MDVRRASFTALASSLLRAVHTRCDAPPLVEDPFGDRLLSQEERVLVLERLLLTLSPEERSRIEAESDPDRALDLAARSTPAYGGILVRARYTEDVLDAAIERGVRWYVLLGAGMDTLALRRRDLAGRLEIVEIDYPATLDLKRERLAAVGVEVPPHLHWVPADLEREPLRDVLARSPYPNRPLALFSWLGVTPYLTREANFATLADIARIAAPRSEVVFDYLDRSAFDALHASAEAKRMVAERSRTQEPFRCGFDPDEMSGELARLGFDLVEDLDPAAAEARYCAARSDGLRLRAPGHIVRARVLPDPGAGGEGPA